MRRRSTLFGGRRGIIVLATLVAAQLSVVAAAEIIVRNGESIAFVSDSNTAAGWDLPSGYLRLVMQALEQAGVKATPIPAGVKVIILTPTLYYVDTDPDNATNQKAPHVEFLRQTVTERNQPLADLNAAHRAEIARLHGDENAPRRFLTWSSVHSGEHGTEQLGQRGSVVMAAVVLETLGFTDEQIATAQEQANYVTAVLEPLWQRALVTAVRAAPPQGDMKAVREAAQIQYGKDLDTLLESGLTFADLKQCPTGDGSKSFHGQDRRLEPACSGPGRPRHRPIITR